MSLFKFSKLLNGSPPTPDAIQAAIDKTETALEVATRRHQEIEAELENALLDGDANVVAAVRGRLTVAEDEFESHRLGLAHLQTRLAEAEENAERARIDAALERANDLSKRGVEIIGKLG